MAVRKNRKIFNKIRAMIKRVKFEGSYPSYRKLPKSNHPHYAFIGRSNVGKSSLINMLTNRKALARVSKQPGKTQMINLFLVNDDWMLVDLPGYGYAKRSKKQRKSWEVMVREYLEHAPSLYCTFLLIDSSIPPQQIDLDFIHWLGTHQIPFSLVFTKIDKVRTTRRNSVLETFRRTLEPSWETLPNQIVVSSITGHGQEALMDYIDQLNQLWGIEE